MLLFNFGTIQEKPNRCLKQEEAKKYKKYILYLIFLYFYGHCGLFIFSIENII
jgi:hypothetical protein